METMNACIGRAKQGSRTAFGQIFGMYFRRLAGYVRCRLGKRHGGLNSSHDIIQSVFRRLLVNHGKATSSLKKVRDQHELERLLFRAIRNRVNEELRSSNQQKRAACRTISEPNPDSLPQKPSTPSFESEIMGQEIVDRVLARLTLTQQAILRYRLQGYTNLEIATFINRCVRSVEFQLDLIRRKVADYPELAKLLGRDDHT